MNICEQCTHYLCKGYGERRGNCYAQPPTVFANEINRRPEVAGKDKACGLFQALAEGETPATKEKTRPDTPGHAAKAARQAKAANLQLAH